ncbi:MAG TPA: hypothetical protein VJ854_04950 [Sphaerochaeta sp.]|nr:hypothetical protein [Sphaerochaeta sp.]
MVLRQYRIALLCLLALVGFGGSLFACEMEFRISGPTMKDMRILPGSTIALEKGSSYTLQVVFTEDHRNCKIPAEDTLFMLDKQKWRVDKAEQAVVLQGPILWMEKDKRTNVATISLVATNAGQRILNIIRTCTKGGYDEEIIFSVT